MAPQPTSVAGRNPPPDLPSMPDVGATLTDYLRTFALWARNGFAAKVDVDSAGPGILLSAYDAPAGNNPPVYMLEVGTTGQLYTARIALGSGDRSAPVRVASRGVTDGSNAPAGEVGEVISASSGNVNVSASTWTNLVTLPLTAGDWDVFGEYRPNPGTTAPNNVACAISQVATGPGVAPPQGAYSQFMGTMLASSNLAFALRPCRWNVTANTNVFLPCFMSAPGIATGNLWARRAR